MAEALAESGYDCQIRTSRIKETDYYSTLSDKEKEDIEFFLEWLQYVEVRNLTEQPESENLEVVL